RAKRGIDAHAEELPVQRDGAEAHAAAIQRFEGLREMQMTHGMPGGFQEFTTPSLTHGTTSGVPELDSDSTRLFSKNFLRRRKGDSRNWKLNQLMRSVAKTTPIRAPKP